MHYSLLIYQSPENFARRDDPVQRAAFREPWMPFLNALRAAGVPVEVTGLQQPGSAVTLRLRHGQRLVEDGPYAETKEQLAGIITIDVPDIADAVAWMWRCPAIRTGVVELRPHLPSREEMGRKPGTDIAGCCGNNVTSSNMTSSNMTPGGMTPGGITSGDKPQRSAELMH